MKSTLLVLTAFFWLHTTVYAQCNADAGPDATLCTGASIQLGATPAGTGTGTLSYSWSPAAGLSCTDCPNPTLTATTSQTYTLTVTASDGCSDDNSVTVTVVPTPIASFTVTGNNNCSNLPVQFNNTSSGTGLSYSWNFGDPGSGGQNTSTAANPAHQFHAVGAGTQTYNVTLTVTNANGCTSTSSQTVTINAIPNPALIDPIAEMRNCDGSNFAMTVYDASGTTAISNYTIQWGDGSPDFNSATFPGGGVSHTYTTAEIFSLNYTVTGTNGCVQTASYNIANITNPAIGAANPGATTGCGPITLCFPLSNYTSNHSTTFYVVDYGDGSPRDTLSHPPPATICHTYTTSSCGQAGNQFVFRIKAINLCDSSEASISPIRVYTGPTANFNVVSTNNCVGAAVVFQNNTQAGFNSACSSSTLFQWNFGDGQTLTTATATSPSHVYTSPGTYTVTLTATNNCSVNVITRTVCIESPPVPAFTANPGTACIPFTTQITDASNLANTCNVTRTWTVLFNGSPCLPSSGAFAFTGGTNASSVNPQIQFTQPGNYTIRLTLTNSCGSFTANQAIVAQKTPQVTINTVPSVCAGLSVSPTAVVNDCLEPSDTYAWTFTGGSPTSASTLIPGAVSYPASGTFPISLAVTNACGTTTANASVVIRPIPPALNPQVNSPVCVGSTANFTSNSSASTTYSWSGPNSFTSSQQNFNLTNVTAAQAGTYTVFGTLAGCAGPSSSVNLVVNPIPVITVTPPNATICNGQSVSLTASGATSYTWSPATGLSATNTATVTASPTATQTYTVTGSDGVCSGTRNVTVTVNPLPVVNAGPNVSLCNQPIPYTLTPTPAGGTWTGANVSSSGVFTPNGTGSFPLVYSFTNANGCTNTDTLIVTVVDPIPASAGPDSSRCFGAGTMTLVGTPAGGTWSGTGITAAGVFTPNTVGTRPLVYTFGTGTCLSRDTMLMTVNPLPVVDAGPNFAVCIDAGIQVLNGTPPGGTWTGTGITNPAGEFNPLTAGAGNRTLTYSFTDVNGCSATDNLAITVNPLPVVNAGANATLCNQPIPYTLTPTPAGGTWSGAHVTPSGIFTPNGTGTFPLAYSFANANGCRNTDTVAITVVDPTQASAGPDSSRCFGAGTIALTGTPAGGTWSGTGITATGVFTPNTVGSRPLIYTFGSGTCLSRDTMLMTVNPLPVVDAGPNFAVCINAGIQTLTGTPAGGTWSGTGITNPSGEFTPAVAGAGNRTLTYSFTDVNGCSASDNLVISVNPVPVVNAGPDSTACDQPTPFQLSASPAGGTWSGPHVTSSGSFTPNGTGTFTLTYTFTNANGCTASDARIITIISPTQPDAGPDFAVCIDAPNVTLSPTPAGGTWTGSFTTPAGIFNPTVVGSFELVYTLGSGACLWRDTVTAVVNPLPIVNAGTDFNVCVNAGTQALNGIPAGGTWSGTGISNPAGAFDPALAGAGTHNVTYAFTDGNGCSSSDILSVVVNPLTPVNAGIDTTLCNQPFAVQFTANPAGGTWTGTGITSSGSFTPASVGIDTLTYTFTNASGCTNSDDRVITVLNPDFSDAGPDLEACLDAPDVQINGNPVSGTWTGAYVNSSGSFNPTIAGTFPLVISNGAGNCLTRDTMLFTVHPLPVVAAGADRAFCPSDDPVNFTGSPVNGVWTGTGITDAAAGTFDPGTAPVGTHTIVYTFTHPITGCINSDTLSVVIHPMPIAGFTSNPITCIGTNEPFTNTSSLADQNNWDFGDSNTSSTTSPTHSYTSAGFYDIELIVTTQFGCRDSITQQVEVRIPPVADFSLAPDSACGPLSVSFTDLSLGQSLTYNWNYGNGQTSTGSAPVSQMYPASNYADTSYTITLNLTNFCGTSSHSESVTVMPSPTAVFGTLAGVGCTPLNLDMVNDSYGLPDNYEWNFGDGSTSTTAAATLQHTFYTGTEDTTYTIQLIVSNECGSDTVTHQVTVLPPQVNAFFNTDNPSGCVPHTINLTQFSQGVSFSSWDFGDGNLSGAYNPTHTFTAPGTYTVSLFAAGCGFDTTTTTVTVHPMPQIDFSSADSVCLNAATLFTNLSTGVSSINWDFGDGTSSTLTNPIHHYTVPGFYTVTLSGVSQTYGCMTQISKMIEVKQGPTSQFTLGPNAGCVDLTIQMANTSTGIVGQVWHFGDGNSSIQTNPTHTFTTAGSYAVQLVVIDPIGCPDTATQVVTVHPLPTVDFTPAPVDPCVQPTVIQFTNTSTNAAAYTWNFGNGLTSTLTHPSSNYQQAGDYSVSLVATSVHGCVDSIRKTVSSYQMPTASFLLPTDSICVRKTVQFNAAFQFADSLLWYLGDGTVLNGNPVEVAFSNSGNYPVTLIAYGDGGCNDTVASNGSITVLQQPTAHFSYENITGSDPASGIVQFTNLSSLADFYSWDLGNGTVTSEENPIEQYEQDGDFQVMLIATTLYGCADTAVQTITVDFFFGLFIPNAMSPGHSDFEVANFIPKGVGMKEFELLIYDDWGNLIWSTTALDADGRPTEYWDGTYRGEPVQQDAYVWKASAIFENSNVWEGKEYPKGRVKRSGTVTVIR